MLNGCCRPSTIFATNTSYLDLDDIASATTRPENVLGLHFFSPAHKMKLLEVVVGAKTAQDVVATGFALGDRLGKTGVRSGVCDGFIGNRILHACRKAADRMVLQGAAPRDVDRALQDFGYAMGPYAVADLAGLDIGWTNRKRLKALHGTAPTAADFPDRLCESGALGRKSGRGYYLYGANGPEYPPNPVVCGWIKEERARKNIAARSFTPGEIGRRYLATTVNEAARILEEGIARRPLDVDVVLIAGYGFPRYHGGPCKRADLEGFEAVVRDVVAFSEADAGFGPPARLLTELVSAGRCFEDLNV
jgi:3-hydroxyacyl-CoA dehydrogenase